MVAVSEVEEKLKDTANTVGMEDVRLKLNSCYNCIVIDTESKEEDVALAAFRK